MPSRQEALFGAQQLVAARTANRRPVAGRLQRELLADEQLAGLTLPAGINAIELRRSAQRRKTVHARVEDDRIVLLLPANLTPDQEHQQVDRMVSRLAAKLEPLQLSNEYLARRAELVARRYLNAAAGRTLRPTSIRWVTNMKRLWGSCSTHSGRIRINHHLQQMPEWVLDYVVAHELAHLAIPRHGADFDRVVAAYPLAQRAQGYLWGWAAAARRRPGSGSDPDEFGEEVDDPEGFS